jgi:RluA family pseudouridine synthase
MQKNKLDIIYEDEHLLAINKAVGIPTLPDRFNSSIPSYLTLLKAIYEEIFVVHRLDIGTSGILLFAKSPQMHTNLNDQFTSHTIIKKYIGIVDGVVKLNEQTIDIPLLSNPNNKGGVIPSARGKESITKIKVLERYRIATLIEAQLITGRQHQLRVHTAAIGHPLLVDPLYGIRTDFFASSLKRRYNIKKETTEKPIISRPTLHAAEITFTKPTNEIITLSAEYPKDFKALIQLLSKYSQTPNN